MKAECFSHYRVLRAKYTLAEIPSRHFVDAVFITVSRSGVRSAQCPEDQGCAEDCLSWCLVSLSEPGHGIG